MIETIKKNNITISIVIARYYINHAKLEKLVNVFLSSLNKNVEIEKINFIDLNSKASKNKNSVLVYNWIKIEPTFFDFSAFVEMDSSSDSDLYLYINDTVFIRHPWKVIAKNIMKTLNTINSLNFPVASGLVYPYSEVLINDTENPSLQHITTHCFILNKEANVIFKNLLSFLPDKEDDDKITAWIESKVSSSAFIDFMLNIHLYGPISPWTWNKKEKTVSKKVLNGKAVSVILEYSLNNEILNSNGLIIPIPRDFKYNFYQKVQSLLGRFYYNAYFK